MDLKDQIAIVTGAGQGMGRGIAEKLAQDGALVVIAAKNEEGAQETARILESTGTILDGLQSLLFLNTVNIETLPVCKRLLSI